MTIMDKKRGNTASWVDERYAKLLARQAVDKVDGGGESTTAMMRLTTMRRSVLFLREERMRVGPGFKTGTRVWHLDAPIPQVELDKLAPGRRTLAGVRVFAVDYDEKGDLLKRNLAARPPLANVSQHALERLFERLHTNALDDVVREALIPMSRLDQPSVEDGGLDVEISLPRVGVMHATVERACDIRGAAIGAFWQIKTFVPRPSA